MMLQEGYGSESPGRDFLLQFRALVRLVSWLAAPCRTGQSTVGRHSAVLVS